MIYLLLCLVLLGLAWIRLAPSDPARWHQPAQVAADETLPGGAKRLLPDPQGWAALHQIIAATPRTQVLAGTPDEGRVTYITRSRIFGFPDYTTVEITDQGIGIFGRLRFGKSDLGVNAARIDGWLRALGQ